MDSVRQPPRRQGRVAVALAALALAVAACAPASAGARISRADAELLGITPSTYLSFWEYAELGQGGVQNLRKPIFWEDLQPQRGAGIDWSGTDEVVVLAAAFGIRLQPFVMGVPRWMGGPGDTSYPPINSQEFRRKWIRLLGALVSRYGPGGDLWRLLRANGSRIEPLPIRSWQIWNEPNATSYWHPARTATEDYAELLRLSARAIKREDRGAEVVVAGLFENPSDGFPAKRFLEELYAVPRIDRSFDAIAVHPYSSHVRGVVRQVRAARGVMRRNGDSEAELWITELGWATEAGTGSTAFVKSEAGQAAILRRAFRLLLLNRRQWRIGALTWYTWRDSDLNPGCAHCSYSGLFRRDLTPKPAWNAFVRLTGGTP